MAVCGRRKGKQMTDERYQYLNSLWDTSPIYALVDAYKSGGGEAVRAAIERLPRQYDPATFMGQTEAAFQVLEVAKDAAEKVVADSLRNIDEYTEYITKIEAEDKAAYECIYMLDFLGSRMYDLIVKP